MNRYLTLVLFVVVSTQVASSAFARDAQDIFREIQQVGCQDKASNVSPVCFVVVSGDPITCGDVPASHTSNYVYWNPTLDDGKQYLSIALASRLAGKTLFIRVPGTCWEVRPGEYRVTLSVLGV